MAAPEGKVPTFLVAAAKDPYSGKGQLLFVDAVLGLMAVIDRLLALRVPRLREVTAYAIGSVAAVWVMQRTATAVL